MNFRELHLTSSYQSGEFVERLEPYRVDVSGPEASGGAETWWSQRRSSELTVENGSEILGHVKNVYEMLRHDFHGYKILLFRKI